VKENDMRIQGRTLRASDLRERRVLLAIGIDPVVGLRVPRSENPFAVARTIKRLARDNDDITFLKMIAKRNKTPEPRPSPEMDVPAEFPDAAAAE
jgi:hypothetical protein